MKKLLVFILAFSAATLVQTEVFGEKNTFFDSVKFVQYLDENTALEEVRNGNLDMYYYRISSDRLENYQDREGLQVFDSTSGSYSILVNPADSEEFNPFSNKDIRFALNYLIDRKLIVNELMGGYGDPIVSYYSPSDPEYLTVIEQLETFNFKYNPTLAEEIISNKLTEEGAIKTGETWEIYSKPIQITIFIRNDDPVRKSIGEVLATELERIGFIVKKDFGDLNKAFVVVYGTNPSDLKWNLYTEGWGRSAFVRYDSSGLSQMYSPWFSNMPGFNDPTYWNYNNKKLDELTQRIYTGDFDSSNERKELIQEAVIEAVNESVRIFVASKIDRYVANERVSGIINDFGAGVPTRFTPINAKSGNDELVIGVKQIYQGAWNPVMGITDTYSKQIWGIISDPGTFKHPFTGETFPIRANWEVETAGPNEKLKVSQETRTWNPLLQKWENVSPDTFATSKVTFNFEFGNWHNGQPIDMNDVLHSIYFTIEWGTKVDDNDRTFDAEFTPRASQSIQTIIGINPIDKDSVEVYVDYWHFDKGEIADWANLWGDLMPWEITSAMEKAVADGKVSFSRSGATNKSINWLSLIIPNDAKIIRDNLQEFKENNYRPPSSLEENNPDSTYYQERYNASIQWIEKKNHAVISNGPYYLESYAPESRMITVKAFDDESYPFKVGKWSEFEDIEFPIIENVEMKKVVQRGEKVEIEVEVSNSDTVQYFLTDNKGILASSGTSPVDENHMIINLTSEDTKKLGPGGNNIKIFAMSDKVLKPDFYESGFIVTESKSELHQIAANNINISEESSEDAAPLILILPIIAIIGFVIYLKRR